MPVHGPSNNSVGKLPGQSVLGVRGLPESLQFRTDKSIGDNLSRSGRFWIDKRTLSSLSISSPSPLTTPSAIATPTNAHETRQGRPLQGHVPAVWPFGWFFPISSPPRRPSLVESVRRPTPLLRVALTPKPWREYIRHFDKYPGGRVVWPSFGQTSDFVDATGHSPGALAASASAHSVTLGRHRLSPEPSPRQSAPP
jgi:hypothetical protein